MHIDLLEKRDELRVEYEKHKNKDMANSTLEGINAINKALGEEEEGTDPLVAKWDREFEAGQMPNFDDD